jgi:hypothetical protein
MPNNRIYYAIQQAGIKADGTANFTQVHGLQSCGMNTTFELTQVFQYGQLALYENIEGLPAIEVNLSKVWDGYPPLYLLATQGTTTTGPDLAGRSVSKCLMALAIFDDTKSSATGTAIAKVEVSGCFVSSLAYNITLDDNAAEELTLVANDKIWSSDPRLASGTQTWSNATSATSFTGAFANNETPISLAGVVRRQDVFMLPTAATGAGFDANGAFKDPDCTTLPRDIPGISSSGINTKNGDNFAVHLVRIGVNTDLGRTAINELGRKGPYTRTADFPIAVNTEIEVTSISGDAISATQYGIFNGPTPGCSDLGNLRDNTIRVATCDGMRLYMGTKNKLQSVSLGGGDTGGSNVTVTYSFQNFNELTVMHSGDPHASGTTWWANRSTYLT